MGGVVGGGVDAGHPIYMSRHYDTALQYFDEAAKGRLY